MAFDPKTDYSALIAKTSDPIKKQELVNQRSEKIASMASQGYNYTNPSDVSAYKATAPVQSPVQSQISTPSSPVVSTQPQPQVQAPAPQNQELVTYYDEFGRPQTFLRSQESEAPKNWTKAPQGTTAPAIQSPLSPIGSDNPDIARIIEQMKQAQALQLQNSSVLNAEAQAGLRSTLESGKNSSEDLLTQLSEAKRKSLIAGLESKKTAGNIALAGEAEAIPKEVQTQKMALRSASALKAKDLAERMSSMGLGSSGATERAQTQIATQELSGLGGLANIETAGIADIAKRKTALGQEYQTGLSTGEASIAENTATEKMNLQKDYANKLLELQNMNFTNKADAQKAQDALNQDMITKIEALRGKAKADATALEEKAKQEAIVAKANELEKFKETASQYNADYTAQINKLIASGVSPQDDRVQYLNMLKSEKVADIKVAESELKKQLLESQAKEKEKSYSNAMDMWKQSGIANQQVASTLGIAVGTPTSDAKFKQINADLDAQKLRASAIASAKSSAPKAMTASQAISLWNTLGTANQQVSSILNVPIGTPTSDYSFKVKSEQAKLLPSNEQEFRNFQLDFSNELDSDPNNAYELLKANKNEIVSKQGLGAYNSMLNQVMVAIDNQ